MSNLVLDIQRRHAEVFRIRLGARNDKGYPTKLTDAIRVTARSEKVVEAFTAVYGGQTQPWDNNGEPQYEAFLPTTELHVMMLPGQSIYQRWELYRNTVCERRCNGQWEEIEDRRCLCPPDVDARLADKRACNIMTRINVICPDVEVVGAGSLVSHGRVAAETLPQSVAIAEAALSRGVMVPAVLRTIEHKGKKHYVVPHLEIVGVSLQQLSTGEVPSSFGELSEASPVEIARPVSSAPALPAAERQAVSPQQRASSPPPLPHELDGGEAPTGDGGGPASSGTDASPPSATASGPVCVRCGGSLAGAAVEKVDGGYAHEGGCPDGSPPPGGDAQQGAGEHPEGGDARTETDTVGTAEPGPTPVGSGQVAEEDLDTVPVARAQLNRMFGLVGKIWPDVETGGRDVWRHRTSKACGFDVTSWRDLTGGQADVVEDLLGRLADGSWELHLNASGDWIARRKAGAGTGEAA